MKQLTDYSQWDQLTTLSINNKNSFYTFYVQVRRCNNKCGVNFEKHTINLFLIYILGLVQNAIVKSTDEDVVVQRDGLYQRMIPIIEAAALAKVNVLCFQEAWSKKFKIKP